MFLRSAKSHEIGRSCYFCPSQNEMIFCPLGCSIGGGGDQKVSAHKELPELLDHSWLLYFWGDKLLRNLKLSSQLQPAWLKWKLSSFFFYQIQLSAHMLHHLRSRKLERRNVWQHNFTKHCHAIISFSLNLFFLSFIYFIVFWKTNRAITAVPSQVIYPCCRFTLYSHLAAL